MTSNLTIVALEQGLQDDPTFTLALTVISSLGLLGCTLGVVSKLTFRYVIPVAWKCCLWLDDAACLALSLGLFLISRYVADAGTGVCLAGGFFTLFGVLDVVSSLAITGFTHCLIQSPTKMSQLSTFRWGLFLAIVLSQKAVTILLSVLPVMPIDYFDTESPYPLACFPIRQEGDKGATFGAILFFIMWGVLITGVVLAVVLSVRYWAGPDTRVHASSPSLWQMQKMEQARSLHKFTLFETVLISVMVLLLTIVVYSNSASQAAPQWVTLLALAAIAMVRVVVSTVHFFMWSVLCGDGTGQKKEPHHRLKQLQLIRSDGRGRLRMKATWAAGKGVWRKGLLKVYGPAHIKAWAQEIVVLGLLRKSQSASVLQCLWTSNTNPYYETMTLISGDIVTSDSRLTCLELTSSGTLQELLKTMDVPLPEPCQRTIMHDVAEGLSYLHDQNVLHRNLTSAAVYIKGSVKCFVLRAAVGDFEEAQIYGTLLTGSPNSTITRKRFFFPDIRSYALVGVEMLASICECRQREKQSHRRAVAVKGQQRSLKSKDAATQAKGGDKKVNSQNHPNHGRHKHRSNFEICDERSVDHSKIQSQPVADKSSNGFSPSSPADQNYYKNSFKENSNYDKSKDYTDRAEYNIDQNWKLQMRMTGNGGNGGDCEDDMMQRHREHGSGNDYNPHDDRYKHSKIPGITNVAPPATFQFPNNSIFRAGSEESAENLGIIEEKIERAQRVKLVAVKGNTHIQGGYITSTTEDGREIFIPASYHTKPSNGTTSGSSGYGSSGGGYSSAHGSSSYSSISNAKFPADSNRQVHKTASAATVSSFEDDILEVLPGMTDVEERPKRHSDGLLKELFKAKRDALEEGLIESYEERVRRGELGSKADDLPDGVVFPKKDRPQNYEPTVEELLTGQRINTDHPQMHSESQEKQQKPQKIEENTQQRIQQHHIVNSKNNDESKRNKNDNQKVTSKEDTNKEILHSSQRPKTAAPSVSEASKTQRMQHGIRRPISASNTSFREWNARSSLKRSKARAALKRALSAKGHQQRLQQIQQHRSVDERGSKAREIEMKYSNRPLSQMSNIDDEIDLVDEDIVTIQKAHGLGQISTLLSPEQNSKGNDKSFISMVPCSSGLPAVEESFVIQHTIEAKKTDKKEPSSRPTVARKPSTKSRPAPPPPPYYTLSPITVSSVPSTSEQDVSHTAPLTSNLANPQNYSESDTDTQSASPHLPDESFTSVEPASSHKSSSTANTHTDSSSYSTLDQTAEKIESDMKEIINSSVASAAINQKCKTNLPAGIRLIDSGFDSASISSEESCLCAAAALEAVEDGDASSPSEIFSQGACSCACSNCLGLNTRADGRNHSSWTGSQDSESWSNSNSFSSYDANMHRRMLPKKREKELPECVLAPDEQYPPPAHRSAKAHGNFLHPRSKYSPKRNHRRLSHNTGQYTSSASETSSVVSRRYRELVKKGVPLRVSVVAVDGEKMEDGVVRNSSLALNNDTQYGDMQNEGHLFNDLEQNGFFDNDRPAGPLHFVDSPRSDNFSEEEDEHIEDGRYQDLSPIPSLEDIIKEIPDETGQFPDETKAFLNRPESEVSIKALQAVLSRTGSSIDDKSAHPGELIIDRIFTHQGPSETMASTFGLSNTGLDLDVSAIREVAMLPAPGSPNDLAVGVDVIGLLPGMDGRHVTYCHILSSQLRLVNINDLLPATPEAFEKLKHRLQQTGRVGRIGNQILDTVLACWLYSTPPTSATVMEQLSDRITETEL